MNSIDVIKIIERVDAILHLAAAPGTPAWVRAMLADDARECNTIADRLSAIVAGIPEEADPVHARRLRHVVKNCELAAVTRAWPSIRAGLSDWLVAHEPLPASDRTTVMIGDFGRSAMGAEINGIRFGPLVDTSPMPKLREREVAVLALIRATAPGTVSGKTIIGQLAESWGLDRHVAQSTLTSRIVPALKAHGLIDSRMGDGYYLSAAPDRVDDILRHHGHHVQR